jgi:hypothetical protein
MRGKFSGIEEKAHNCFYIDSFIGDRGVRSV